MVNRERTVPITTSIPLSLWNLAKEKHFPWNECLILGIRTMNGEGLAPTYRKMQEKVDDKEAVNSILREKINKLMEDSNETTN